MQPYRDSSDAVDDASTIQQRANDDGYLFVRGLLDPAAVLEVRAQFCEVLSRHGWLKQGVDSVAAETEMDADPKYEGQDAYWPVFDDFQRLEGFHALAHSSPIVALMEKLLGEPVLVHPRNIGRIIFPSSPKTPAHQDYLHIQGTRDTWTAWMPLGDCSVDLGALAVLSGGDRSRMYPVERMVGAGGAGIDFEKHEVGGHWVCDDMQAGDVLFFHSYTVHKGMPNTTQRQIRLSCDFRYQAASQPVVDGSLLPHFGRQSWDNIYEGWQDQSIRHYWQDMGLDVVGHDAGMAATLGAKY